LMAQKEDYFHFKLRVGWYIPRIFVSYVPGQGLNINWRWEFFADFMGEESFEHYDRRGHLLNCPRCYGYVLTKRYIPVGEGAERYFGILIRCERCKHEYPEPGGGL
jgi:hypothetical protein